MTVSPTDPRRSSSSSQDARPPGWDPRARSGSGDRQVPIPGRAPPEGQLAGSAVSRTRRVGPYRLLGLIAQGGMGAVYSAVHEGLGRTVALKTMLPGASSGEDVERFLREAKAASRLAHPNLVPIYDVGEAEGVRYLAMELVHGQTLHERIRQSGRLEEGQALAVMIGATEGLAHAHASGILHRDLKPANIIVQPDGTPRVTDFGVAKSLGNTRLTATGTALGTPNYMSPEQAMGLNEQLDARTDVWGLGAILYECLTGQPPFNEGSQVATMQAVVNRPVEPPRTVHPEVSRDVEAICLKCLQRDREERYPSCDELLRDLRACQAGRTIRARVPGAVLRAARRLRRNAVIASLATLSAGSLLALALVLLSNRHPPPPVAVDAVAQAEAWLAARRVLLADPGLTPERLTALAAELGEVGVPEGAPEGLVRAAPAEGLRQLRAEVAARRGGNGASTPEQAELARAAALDPAGPAGRRARLALALRLEERREPTLRALLRAELGALAGGQDEVAGEAARRLLRPLLEAARWEEALALASVDDPLRPLVHALTPVLSLQADRLLALPGLRPTLLLQRGPELSRWSPGSDPTSLLTLDPQGGVRFLGALPAAPPRTGPPALLAEGLPARELRLQPLGADALPRPRSLTLPFPEGAARLAAGDFDGDGVPDLAILPWDYTFQALAASARADGPTWRVFTDTAEDKAAQSPWLIGATGAADLDGDGKEELLLGSSSLRPAGVMVRRLEGKSFRSAGVLGLPACVTALASWPLPGEAKRRGVLAVVDWSVGAELHLAEPGAGLPGWAGRDGLYLLELAGEKRLELRGHWTWGPDEPPSPASVGLAEGVQGWVMRLGGEPWLARAAELVGGPRLELTRLSRVLAGEAQPELSVDLQELPDEPPQVVDVDGDGEDELLWGGRLLGAGTSVARVRPADDPQAALGRLPRLVAAAAPGAEPALAGALAGAHPQLAGEARLAAAEVPLELALAARGEASRAFLRGLPEAGRGRWEEADRLLERAGEAADALAMRGADGQLPPRERTEAALLAEAAWSRLGRRERAAAALERARAVDLPAGLSERLDAAEARLRREERPGPWVARLQGQGENALVPTPGPLAGRLRGGALELDVDPQRESGATARLRLPPGPVALEALLRLDGPAWVGRVELGLFGGETPDALTGLQLDLWNVFAGRPSTRLVVGGSSTGELGWLPSFHLRLRVRLELEPLPEGTRLTARVEDAASGALLLAAERVSPRRLPAGSVRVGVRCPPYPRREEAADDNPSLGSTTSVSLESLQLVGAPAPTALAVTARQRGDVALLAGSPQAALAAYDEALADQDLPRSERHAALCHRAFARGRLGQSDAHEDLVAAARLDPLATVQGLEDAAEPLLFHAPEEDRRTVARALEALQRAEEPLLRLIAAALRGVPPAGDAVAMQGGTTEVLAAAYACLLADPGLRPESLSFLAPEEAAGLRLPRTPWARVLDFPLEPLGEAERRELTTMRGNGKSAADWRELERRIVRLIASDPKDPAGWSLLSRMYFAKGLVGHGLRCLWRQAELAGNGGTWLQMADYARQRGQDDELILEAAERAIRAGLRDGDWPAFRELVETDPRRRALAASAAFAELTRRAEGR